MNTTTLSWRDTMKQDSELAAATAIDLISLMQIGIVQRFGMVAVEQVISKCVEHGMSQSAAEKGMSHACMSCLQVIQAQDKKGVMIPMLRISTDRESVTLDSLILGELRTADLPPIAMVALLDIRGEVGLALFATSLERLANSMQVVSLEPELPLEDQTFRYLHPERN